MNQTKQEKELVRLNQLKDKLLDLSSRSRKIRFRISKRLSWDLVELLNKNDPQLVNNFSTSVLNLLNSSEKKENRVLDLELFFQPLNPEERRKFQEKVVLLQKENQRVYQEKGYKSLFLGVFFLRGYFYDNKKNLRLVNAPLFLLPCNLERFKNLNLVFNSARKINYNLLYCLQKELDLTKEKLVVFLNKLEKENQETENWESYLLFLTQELQNLVADSSLKIKSRSLISSLDFRKSELLNGIRTQKDEEVNASPFSEPTITSEENQNFFYSNRNKENNFEKFFKMGEKNPPVKFSGKIIETEHRKVEKGKYTGNNYYLLLVEHNDKRYINPKKIFVFESLLRDKSIWQQLLNQKEQLGKFYVFYCWGNSPMGFKLSFWDEVGHHNLTTKEYKNDFVSQRTNKETKEFQQKEGYFSPELFDKLTLSNKPKNYPVNHLEIVLNFCLTIDSEPNLSLFRDFERIIQEHSNNTLIHWPPSALSLLRGEVEGITYPKNKETDNQPVPLYTPFSSDPSQTRILKVIFQNFSANTLCIDGPPGTGKSQLICNLLANALFYQKKVLVICEKEVALKVIYDKLTDIGLGRSMIKINELAQTTQIYQNITSYLTSSQSEKFNRFFYLNSIKQITSLEEKQTANLQKIEKYGQVEKNFWTSRQISLSEIYLKFDRKKQLSSELIQLNQGIENHEQLVKLKLDLVNYTSKFGKILTKWKSICLQLKNLFWEESSRHFEFDLENQNNFLEVVNSLLQELKGERTEINFISRFFCLKLAQQTSSLHQSSNYLAVKLKDLAELQSHQKYQNFWIFCQIENWTDFQQKGCSQEFLISLRQFISEEFLNLGELNYFLTNLDQNAKKNIFYFLEKILVRQGFNYLNDYEKMVEQTVYFNWIKETETKNKEVLVNWNQTELVKIQQEQKEISQQKINLAKIILRSQQQENLNKMPANQGLIRELSKKRKVVALKKLFPILVDYFPIWLTTPEIIASITDLSAPTFDFLVFDEASQMPLEKSIPLWARAKKCIIIGDEQQLPPTDFFRAHLETGEEIWDQEEAEFIEEENLNLETEDLTKNSNLLSYAKRYTPNQQKLTLLYHYRSRYPELIEFSNQAFYDGILQIVSAGKSEKKDYRPLEYHHLEKGCWINQENQTEAYYIVNYLLKNPTNQEIGIITFNSKQRDLLTDLIGDNYQKNNLFIKSLEEVQGDERDIIIFSIGYARNEKGKFYLRFGPLGQEGGEKRLNVAISRAREKLIIVTSIWPEDLKRITDEDENRNLGPKLFKKYLEYAYFCSQKEFKKVQNILESLPKIIPTSQKGSQTTEFGSFFEEQVYQELIKLNLNYEIHQQVKSIGYHIDLAVWDKQNQQYILGIECDGEYWHNKLENIERDIYRQQLLESKGWKIIRILSRDWSRNKDGEIERIKRAINGLT